MKPAYERPVLVRHVTGANGKFGAIPPVQPMSTFDGFDIEDLVATYGSPLFVFSERMLRSRVRSLREELARRFADFTIAWSYKTNYLSAICRVLHQEGAWGEVVSGLELRKALHHGVPGDRIIFNGPSKSARDLELAFRSGALVQINHLDELALAEKVAAALEIRPAVGIRVHVAEVPGPAWERFGFHLESGRALEAARRLARSPHLDLRSLHCHVGTFVLDREAYRIAARALGDFAIALGEHHGIHIDSLDFGGGFASRNTLQSQYLPGDESAPSFGQYVERIASGLDEAYKGAPLPRVVLETGRAIVDETAIAVSSVLGNKRLRDGRRAVILDLGVNLLPTAWWYRHEIRPVKDLHGASEPTVFFGPLCMNIDVIRDRILFRPLAVGDRVVVSNVGAYNLTQWMQFITERPNVVMVGSNGRHAIIRRAEGLESLLSNEELPSWLST